MLADVRALWVTVKVRNLRIVVDGGHACQGTFGDYGHQIWVASSQEDPIWFWVDR